MYMKKDKIISNHFSRLGEKGGKSRWANKTEEEKKAYGKMLVDARRAKHTVDKSKDINKNAHLTT